MADPTVLNINDDIMIERITPFKKVLSERCFGLLGCISTNLDHHFFCSFVEKCSDPVKNVAVFVLRSRSEPAKLVDRDLFPFRARDKEKISDNLNRCYNKEKMEFLYGKF
jgi:hypothetical protein